MIQPLARDQLHDIVVIAVVFADSEDGNDVRVMQTRCGLGFADKTRDLLWRSGQLRQQDLHRDSAIQGLVHRFVHNPHASLTDPSDDPVVAQSLDVGSGSLRARLTCQSLLFAPQRELLHHLDRWKQFPNLVRQFGVRVRVLRDGRRFARRSRSANSSANASRVSSFGSDIGSR